MIRINRKGQSMLEYTLLFAIVLVVLIVFLQPRGFFYRQVDNALDISMDGFVRMASSLNLDDPSGFSSSSTGLRSATSQTGGGQQSSGLRVTRGGGGGGQQQLGNTTINLLP